MQFTNTIMLSTEWSEIASSKQTVLVQRLDVSEIRLFVGDEEPGDEVVGHVLASGALKTASFDGLPATKVWARVSSSDDEATASVTVTAF